MMPTMI